MLSNELKKGQVVKARCGRDQGKLFFIYDIVDENRVLIVDGKSRKLSKPKLKKIRHLNILKYVDENINEMLKNGEEITDAYLRAQLNKLK